MQLNDPRPAEAPEEPQAHWSRRSSGHGTTAGRGTKGQLPLWRRQQGAGFEGGQQLAMRLLSSPALGTPTASSTHHRRVDRLRRSSKMATPSMPSPGRQGRHQAHVCSCEGPGDGELTSSPVKVDKVSARPHQD